MKYNGLNLSHYFSNAVLLLDSTLIITGLKSYFFRYWYIYLFIQKSIKVGVSYVVQRYCKANITAENLQKR